MLDLDRSTIELFNLVRLHDSIEDDLSRAMASVIDSASFIGGPIVLAFEEAFARYQGTDHAIGCGSGTDALSLALRGLGVGPGDEVIVPATTFVATAEAVVHVGATPVIVDVEPDTLLISAAAVAEARTARTRAVMPVHIYGSCVSAGLIEGWRRDGLIVVEDAAQAHGATYGDRPGSRAGTVGDAACFSFYPGKNLGGFGDGGAVATNHGTVADAITVLRNHGRQGKFDHDVIGYCSRLDTLQAAILSAKLAHLDEWNTRRRALAAAYDDALAGHPALTPLEHTPGSVHHQYVLRVAGPTSNGSAGARDRFLQHLAEHKIRGGIHYPRAISEYSAYRPFSLATPVAEAAAASIASLPMDPLITPEELDRIRAALAAWPLS